jgi:hypothetical protein
VVMTVPIDASSASLREVQPPASPTSDEAAPQTLASLP